MWASVACLCFGKSLPNVIKWPAYTLVWWKFCNHQTFSFMIKTFSQIKLISFTEKIWWKCLQTVIFLPGTTVIFFIFIIQYDKKTFATYFAANQHFSSAAANMQCDAYILCQNTHTFKEHIQLYIIWIIRRRKGSLVFIHNSVLCFFLTFESVTTIGKNLGNAYSWLIIDIVK